MGDLIRKERFKAGISLRELARRSELTSSFLSQVENGQSQLSLASLEKISRGLDIPLRDILIASEEKKAINQSSSAEAPTTNQEPSAPKNTPGDKEKEQEIFFVPSGGGPQMLLPDRNITTRFLTPNLGRGLEVIHSTGYRISGNTAKTLGIYKKEVIYLLEGSVRLEIGDHTYQLEPGDSIYYAGSELKGFHCLSEEAQWLSIIAR